MENRKKINDLRDKIKHKAKEVETLTETTLRKIQEISVDTELEELKKAKKKEKK